jgi:hypothetical protein
MPKLLKIRSQVSTVQVQEDKEIICNYCKKAGHLKSQCFKLLRKNQNQAEGICCGILTTMTANGLVQSAREFYNKLVFSVKGFMKPC